MISRGELRHIGAFFALAWFLAGCVTGPDGTESPVAAREDAYTDISDCESGQAAEHEATLVAAGYTKTGTSQYEVVGYQFWSNNYWKTVDAHRYENAGRVRYATCKGIIAAPLPLNAGPIALTGEYLTYGCQYPCRGEDYGWQPGPAGTATVEVKDFGLAPLGGDGQLTVHITAVTPRTKIDEDVVLRQNGNSWSNPDRMVSLDVAGEKVVAATLTTRPAKYDPYDPAGTRLHGRAQFRFKDEHAHVPAVKTVTLVDLPTASGIRATPASLTFAPGEGRVVQVVNASSWPLSVTPSMGTPGTLGRNESLTLSVGLPSILRVSPYPEGEVIVDLMLSP